MKIAILGAAGFIGRNLVCFFKEKHEVLAFVRRDCEKELGVRYFKWDNHNLPTFQEKIDICIDCISDVDYTKSERELLKNNVTILEHTKKFLSESKCDHYIYLSSSSVYMGNEGILSEKIFIDEDKLLSAYPKSKFLAEKYIGEHFGFLNKVSLIRPRAVYGAGDTTLIPRILRHQILSFLILPSGDSLTSVTHIDNLCRAIEQVILYQKGNLEVYNVSDEIPLRYSFLYGKIVKKYSKRGIIRLPKYLIRFMKYIFPNKWGYIEDTFLRDKVLDISKIRTLGYNPRYDIEMFLK